MRPIRAMPGARPTSSSRSSISRRQYGLRDRFLRRSLWQQVGDGCLHLIRGASARGFRHHIRPEQGLVGTCPEACDGNGGADCQEARRQGSPPRQLSKRRSTHIQGSSKRATRPVGTSPATSMRPRARSNNGQVRCPPSNRTDKRHNPTGRFLASNQIEGRLT